MTSFCLLGQQTKITSEQEVRPNIKIALLFSAIELKAPQSPHFCYSFLVKVLEIILIHCNLCNVIVHGFWVLEIV